MIKQATLNDWEEIYGMCKKNGNLLGPVFPPEIRDHINKDMCIISLSEDCTIAGFVLYTVLKRNPKLMTVNVICVDAKYRGNHIASDMLDYLQQSYHRSIKTTCIKDSDSELFWKSVAIKTGELPGKSVLFVNILFHVVNGGCSDGI